jgi:hypothetical protein
MNLVFSKIMIVTCTIVYALLVALLASSTLEAIRYSSGFAEYPQPYRAIVVGFEVRETISRRSGKSYAPVVKVRPPHSPEFTFNSQIFGNFNWVSVGDEVLVVHKTVENFGVKREAFEIKSSYHLWVRDVVGFVLLLIPGFCVFWALVRDRLRQRRRDKEMFMNGPRAFRG